MRIDTKELRQIADGYIAIPSKGTALNEAAAELDRLYALEDATKPFASRADVETYLKGKGFVPNSKYISQFNHPNHTGWIDIEVDCDKPMFRFASITVPISALTPALLDKILEAK